MSSTAHGYFVWHDLITSDVPAAIDFYSKVIGWKTQAFDPEGKYKMWVGKHGAVGGVGPAPEGVHPYWRVYIGTDDIDATMALAQQLGGSVVTPVMDIPPVGKWAALSDPQGNEFGLFWSADAKAPVLKMDPGEFHWHELATDDYQSAFQFYQKLFGWKIGRELDMGEMGRYSLFTHTERPQGMGGMFNRPQSKVRGGWCTYTIVKDINTVVRSIKKLGGTTTNKPTQVPGGSWVVKFTDPQGVSQAVTASENSALKTKPTEAAASKPKTKATAKAKPKSKKPSANMVATSVKQPAKKKAATKAKKTVIAKVVTKDKREDKKAGKKKKKEEKALKKLKKKKDKAKRKK